MASPAILAARCLTLSTRIPTAHVAHHSFDVAGTCPSFSLVCPSYSYLVPSHHNPNRFCTARGSTAFRQKPVWPASHRQNAVHAARMNFFTGTVPCSYVSLVCALIAEHHALSSVYLVVAFTPATTTRTWFSHERDVDGYFPLDNAVRRSLQRLHGPRRLRGCGHRVIPSYPVPGRVYYDDH